MLENIPSPCDQKCDQRKKYVLMVICVRNCVGFMVYFSDAWSDGSYIPSSLWGVPMCDIVMCTALRNEDCILSL